jgi:hypothetical protein
MACGDFKQECLSGNAKIVPEHLKQHFDEFKAQDYYNNFDSFVSSPADKNWTNVVSWTTEISQKEITNKFKKMIKDIEFQLNMYGESFVEVVIPQKENNLLVYDEYNFEFLEIE